MKGSLELQQRRPGATDQTGGFNHSRIMKVIKGRMLKKWVFKNGCEICSE